MNEQVDKIEKEGEDIPKKSKVIIYFILSIIFLLLSVFMLLIEQLNAAIGPFFLAFLTLLYVKSLNEKRKS